VKSAVPVMLKLMVSLPEPAIHSPAVAPLAMSLLEALMASLKVQTPSLASVSAVEFTVMVEAALAGLEVPA
jgi:hypothetical protein